MKKKFYHHVVENKAIMYTFSGLLLFLVMLSFRQLFRQKKAFTTDLISENIKQLNEIFNEIHKNCTIIDFDDQKNSIDFLNVISFAGSKVGSMNLKYPEKWQGPYLKENLTTQEKPYLIVKTKKGLFITPGEGVKLPNGKVVGKDIPLTFDADLASLRYNQQSFLINNHPLIAPLVLEKNEGAVPFNEQ